MKQANEVIEGIAIIGMAGQFPGAKNIAHFWQNLANGVESISRFSDEELLYNGESSEKIKQPNYVKAGTILDNVDMFDADFFGYSRREAEIMDPQQRLFMETAWAALENAGYNPETYDGSIGLFAGASTNDYRKRMAADRLSVTSGIDAFQVMVGNDVDFLTTRVSYKLNLKGPSLTIQTACSTSLVAVHFACQSLLTYQCDMALSGGVCIRFPQGRGYIYHEGMIWSPDGHCRAFDADAKGTVFGHGVGIVVLKRLSEALEDGDTLLAVIKGSAVNNDGFMKVGFTAPSVEGQVEVISMAQALAGVTADSISYVEAHGTATSLGDPIEIEALTQAFQASASEKGFCAIGSVKTNIGHLDVAAGIAGLIKTILALQHRKIPPSLHYRMPNPNIDFENSPFFVNSKLTDWKNNGQARRAGVSSFGIGGTNAHVVLEEAPATENSGQTRSWQLVLLSARTATALESMTVNLIDHLRQHPDLRLADMTYTLQVGRKYFNHRRIAVCRDVRDAVLTLSEMDRNRVLSSSLDPCYREVVFMFSGQGSQYVNMGLDLYNEEPIFQQQVDYCSEILKSHLGFDLRDILYPAEEKAKEATKELTQTYITQPALFVIEYSLAKLWQSWGISPTAMVGHSIGEYVAACLSGVFSLEDALALVAVRGRLMQDLPPGAMLAVPLSEEQVQPYLTPELSLAVINGASMCVISGETEAIEKLDGQLTGQDINCHILRTSHAFHSAMMEPILDTFIGHVGQIPRHPPQIPFLSNVSGTWITAEEATNPAYWARHLRQTVRFYDCVQELLYEPNRILLEVGPGNTLYMLARQHPDKTGNHVMLSSTRRPVERKNDVQFILNTLGQLWLAGIQVDWQKFYANENRSRIPLPTYPFERKRHWINAGKQIDVDVTTTSISSEEKEKGTLSNSALPDQKIDGIYYDDAPRNDIEQSVANIWQKLLGVEQLKIHDNFFDLGGSSLIAVKLFTQIEMVFGKRLPLATLYEAPTIEQLSSIIGDEENTASWKSLVKIQPGKSTKPPFFCIHAAGGNVLNYRDLARHLGEDQPVYGLQAQGLDGKQPFLTNIEDMADHYISEIQRLQPDGPYMFGGYCLGGTIAFEMAQQLSKQGEKVSLLAFFETYNWANMKDKNYFDEIYYYVQKMYFHLSNFLLSDNKITFCSEKAKDAKSRGKMWFSHLRSTLSEKNSNHNEDMITLAKLWKNNDSAAFKYKAEKYPGKITFFKPIKEYALNTRPGMDWYDIAEGGVSVHELPVYPAAMLMEPFVHILAKELKGCIENVLQMPPKK